MRQDSTSGTRPQIAEFMNNPWAQAILTGALTLIPARKYPNWMRSTLIWGPTIAGGAAGAYLATNRNARRKLAVKMTTAEHSTPQSLRPPEPPAEFPSPGKNRTASTILLGCAVGGVVSLGTAASLWADEKIDRGLQRLHVPFPRLVMGIAAGAFTWWQLEREKKASSRDSH